MNKYESCDIMKKLGNLYPTKILPPCFIDDIKAITEANGQTYDDLQFELILDYVLLGYSYKERR